MGLTISTTEHNPFLGLLQHSLIIDLLLRNIEHDHGWTSAMEELSGVLRYETVESVNESKNFNEFAALVVVNGHLTASIEVSDIASCYVERTLRSCDTWFVLPNSESSSNIKVHFGVNRDQTRRSPPRLISVRKDELFPILTTACKSQQAQWQAATSNSLFDLMADNVVFSQLSSLQLDFLQHFLQFRYLEVGAKVFRRQRISDDFSEVSYSAGGAEEMSPLGPVPVSGRSTGTDDTEQLLEDERDVMCLHILLNGNCVVLDKRKGGTGPGAAAAAHSARVGAIAAWSSNRHAPSPAPSAIQAGSENYNPSYTLNDSVEENSRRSRRRRTRSVRHVQYLKKHTVLQTMRCCGIPPTSIMHCLCPCMKQADGTTSGIRDGKVNYQGKEMEIQSGESSISLLSRAMLRRGSSMQTLSIKPSSLLQRWRRSENVVAIPGAGGNAPVVAGSVRGAPVPSRRGAADSALPSTPTNAAATANAAGAPNTTLVPAPLLETEMSRSDAVDAVGERKSFCGRLPGVGKIYTRGASFGEELGLLSGWKTFASEVEALEPCVFATLSLKDLKHIEESGEFGAELVRTLRQCWVKKQLMELRSTLPMVRVLTVGDIERLSIVTEVEVVQRDQVVFQQDDEGDKFYIVARGCVNIYRAPEKKVSGAKVAPEIHQDPAAGVIEEQEHHYGGKGEAAERGVYGGKDKQFTPMSEGSCFGEVALVASCTRAVTVVAADTSVLLSISRECFSSLFQENRSVLTELQLSLIGRDGNIPLTLVLQHPKGYQLLLTFLTKELSQENLLFWREVDELESYVHKYIRKVKFYGGGDGEDVDEQESAIEEAGGIGKNEGANHPVLGVSKSARASEAEARGSRITSASDTRQNTANVPDDSANYASNPPTAASGTERGRIRTRSAVLSRTGSINFDGAAETSIDCAVLHRPLVTIIQKCIRIADKYIKNNARMQVNIADSVCKEVQHHMKVVFFDYFASLAVSPNDAEGDDAHKLESASGNAATLKSEFEQKQIENIRCIGMIMAARPDEGEAAIDESEATSAAPSQPASSLLRLPTHRVVEILDMVLGLFVKAKAEVLSMMNADGYRRWKQTPEYEKFVAAIQPIEGLTGADLRASTK